MELKLGEKQTLVIVKKVEFGVYLATKEAPEDKVLLPAKQVPAGAKVGDEVEVFLYRDSSDRLIATTRTPKLIMGQVALLTVVQIGKVGAFRWALGRQAASVRTLRYFCRKVLRYGLRSVQWSRHRWWDAGGDRWS